jgi:small basic protein
MNLTTLWGPIVGLVLPLVIGLLLKCSWPEWAKALTALAVSAAVGVGGLAIQGALVWSGDLAAFVALVFTASQVTFWGIVQQVPSLKSWLNSHGVTDKDAVC